MFLHQCWKIPLKKAWHCFSAVYRSALHVQKQNVTNTLVREKKLGEGNIPSGREQMAKGQKHTTLWNCPVSGVCVCVDLQLVHCLGKKIW